MKLDELKSFLNDKQILTDPQSTAKWGRDWTTYFDINASAIVFPETADQVVQIVKWARTHKVGLVPSGGRTGLSGAAVATNGEIVVSFDRMNKISKLNPVDNTVTVQPGVVTEALQNFALENNLFYPVDFAARGSSQMGGNIATNAGGIKVLRYGLTRNWITGLKVVTGTGELLSLNNNLVKNATGYDLRHLFIGSEGTLGFVVEATVQLIPKPQEQQVLLMAVNDLQNLMKVFAQFKNHVSLTAFEFFSDLALQKVIGAMKLSSPFDKAYPFYIVAEVEKFSTDDEDKIMKAFEECLEKDWITDGVVAQSASQAKTFWRFREDISESLSKFSPYKNDISVQIDQVPGFMNSLDKIIKANYPKWEVVWFGHIGDGNLHLNILRPDGMSKEDFVKDCQKVDVLIFQEIQKFAGSISAEHGVGLTKKPFLQFSRSQSEIQIMKGIKKIFDPDNIINPGKIF
jgi:glycolate oxidase subunit GlcD